MHRALLAAASVAAAGLLVASTTEAFLLPAASTQQAAASRAWVGRQRPLAEEFQSELVVGPLGAVGVWLCGRCMVVCVSWPDQSKPQPRAR
jgi:hypothetical protein